MRYAQGGGMSDAERARRELVRMQAAELFAQGRSDREVTDELRVTRVSANRWRRAWRVEGSRALASKGPACRPRLGAKQFAKLETVLKPGPAAHGWADQRWTLARIKTVIGRKFPVSYSLPGVWKLLRRHGWSCQVPARRAVERDDGAVEVFKSEVWPQAERPQRTWVAGSASRTSAAAR